jgi:precorrin-6B C5,15-methyltransferase / cobalt-precorrin-6B C5,C15-methyltransferase
VPGLQVITGTAPAALAGLPAPDAVFIGGGLTADGLLETCWQRLPRGGRLVAHAVTIESETVLHRWQQAEGGELVKVAVSHAEPLGSFTTWRPALPVTQWQVTAP